MKGIASFKNAYFSEAEDISLIKQDIKNLLLTSKGERVMRSDFGADIPSGLFEPVDGITLGTIEHNIKSQLAQHETRLLVGDVKVSGNSETGKINVFIELISKKNPSYSEKLYFSV